MEKKQDAHELEASSLYSRKFQKGSFSTGWVMGLKMNLLPAEFESSLNHSCSSCCSLVMCVFSHNKYHTLINQSLTALTKKKCNNCTSTTCPIKCWSSSQQFFEKTGPQIHDGHLSGPGWRLHGSLSEPAARVLNESVTMILSSCVIFMTRGTQNRSTTGGSLWCVACTCRTVGHRWHNDNYTTTLQKQWHICASAGEQIQSVRCRLDDRTSLLSDFHETWCVLNEGNRTRDFLPTVAKCSYKADVISILNCDVSFKNVMRFCPSGGSVKSNESKVYCVRDKTEGPTSDPGGTAWTHGWVRFTGSNSFILIRHSLFYVTYLHAHAGQVNDNVKAT